MRILPQVLEAYPHFFHKTDRWGRPVCYELIGELDAARLMAVTTVDRLVEYHVRCWEATKRHLLPECSRRAGREVRRCPCCGCGVGRSAHLARAQCYHASPAIVDSHAPQLRLTLQPLTASSPPSQLQNPCS